MMQRHFSRHSLRLKLFAGVLLVTLTALLVLAGALVLNDLHDYRTRLAADLTTQANLIGLSAVPALQFRDPELAAASLALLEVRPNVLAAALYDAEGAQFAAYSATDGAAAPPPRLTSADARRFDDARLIVSQAIIENGELLGIVYIEGSYQLLARLRQYLGIVAGVMLLALLISMPLSVWLQRRIATPILQITSLARRVTEERNYDLRARKVSDDEVGLLADSLNDLLAEVGARNDALEAANTQVLILNEQLEQRVAERTAELELANNELESFSYSVSHDLRTPLRAIDGFSQALLEDYSEQLDDTGRDYLTRVRAGAQRMGQLIDDLLKLARVSRVELNTDLVDLSAAAESIVADLRERDTTREVTVDIAPGMLAPGDAHLLGIALENLLNNAWKYTSKQPQARIAFGRRTRDDQAYFFVEDNGAGFDMAYADKLFGAFQRLHDAREFAGSGVGLATVQRIIHRHGGTIWAEAAVGEGATFNFTLRHVQGEPR